MQTRKKRIDPKLTVAGWRVELYDTDKPSTVDSGSRPCGLAAIARRDEWRVSSKSSVLRRADALAALVESLCLAG